MEAEGPEEVGPEGKVRAGGVEEWREGEGGRESSVKKGEAKKEGGREGGREGWRRGKERKGRITYHHGHHHR